MKKHSYPTIAIGAGEDAPRLALPQFMELLSANVAELPTLKRAIRRAVQELRGPQRLANVRRVRISIESEASTWNLSFAPDTPKCERLELENGFLGSKL